MRFFKTFNLLHRRTKSETFIPGFVQSDPARLTGTAVSALFEFATPAVPPTFSHRRGVHHVTDAVRAGRDSECSMPSLMVEENIRLREALDLWFREYSQVDELLQKCRAELAFERERIRFLQQGAVRDQEVIIKLREDLTHCRRDKGLFPAQTRETYGSSSALLLPALTESMSSLRISGKLRTLDDYTSALRLTLNARRKFRDQKKISKFWKATALSTGKCEEMITPSTSNISSVHESLPPERQAAVESFMHQRGLPLPRSKVLAQVGRTSELSPPAPTSGLLCTFPHMDINQDLSLISTSHKSLPYPSSWSSGISHIHPVASAPQELAPVSSVVRLAPLASESLKAEINMLFGIQGTAGRCSSLSKTNLSCSDVFSAASTMATMGPSSSRLSNVLRFDNLNPSLGSRGDFNLLVSSLLFHDAPPQVKFPMMTVTDSHVMNLSTSSDEALPVDRKLSNGAEEMLGVLQSVNVQNQTSKMTRPSGRSWQKYLAAGPNKKITAKATAKKIAEGKENSLTFGKHLSLLRKTSSKGV